MSPMAEKLVKWSKLTRHERRILLLALFMLPTIAFGLRLRGLQRVRSVLTGHEASISTSTDGEHMARAIAVARLVAAAARYGPYRAKCLPVSLTLSWLLQGYGITTNLRLGVRRTETRIDAHAWVEFRGIPLIDAPEVGDQFTAFDPIPLTHALSRP